MNNRYNMNLSFWEKDAFFSTIDVAIIGSGIVGLSAAIRLKEQYPSWNVVILERGTLPSGASTKNAGFASFGSISELIEDLEYHTVEEVYEIAKMRWKGLQKLRQRLGDKAIGYQHFGGYELFQTKDQSIFETCLSRMKEINSFLEPILGINNFYDASSKVPSFQFSATAKLIGITSEGQIHTGYMMKNLLKTALLKGIQIINGITISTIKDGNNEVHLETSKGWTIKARKVIAATNGLTPHLLPTVSVKPARNQVLITQPIPNLTFKGTCHFDRGYYYFRNVGNRILLGGGRNIASDTEQTSEFGLTEQIQQNLIKHLKMVILPHHNIEIDSWWSGILGVGQHKTPIIKHYSNNVVVAVRLAGIGVAIGSTIGELAADLLVE